MQQVLDGPIGIEILNSFEPEAAIRSSRFMQEKWKDLEERSRRQAEAGGVTIVPDFDRKPFEAAMAGTYAKAQGDPAAAELIERIGKVE